MRIPLSKNSTVAAILIAASMAAATVQAGEPSKKGTIDPADYFFQVVEGPGRVPAGFYFRCGSIFALMGTVLVGKMVPGFSTVVTLAAQTRDSSYSLASTMEDWQLEGFVQSSVGRSALLAGVVANDFVGVIPMTLFGALPNLAAGGSGRLITIAISNVSHQMTSLVKAHLRSGDYPECVAYLKEHQRLSASSTSQALEVSRSSVNGSLLKTDFEGIGSARPSAPDQLAASSR